MAELLSGGKYIKHEIDKYSRAFEFRQTLNGQLTNIMITHCQGHPQEYMFTNKKWPQPEDYMRAEIKPYLSKMGAGVNRAFEQFSKQTERLILCTDNDREGEHIAWECCELFAKRRTVNVYPAGLPSVRKNVYSGNIISEQRGIPGSVPAVRVRFSALTREMLLEALQHPQPLNIHTIESVDVRLQLDLRIGFAFSTLQSCYRSVLCKREDRDRVSLYHRPSHSLSFGTCQIPTLGLCQLRDCPNYEDRVTMNLTVKEGGAKVNLKSKAMPRVAGIEHAASLQTKFAQSQALDVLVKSEIKFTPPPAPPNTLALQKFISGKGVGAKAAMSAAEKLYMAGLLSYPRTETQVFVQDLDCLETIKMLGKQAKYESYVRNRLFGSEVQIATHSNSSVQYQSVPYETYLAQLVSSGAPGKSKTRKDDQSHPPLHPIRAPQNGKLQNTEETVYDAVSRLFLASVSRPKKTMTIHFSTVVQGVEYMTSKDFVIDPGYEEIIYNKSPDRIPPELAQFCDMSETEAQPKSITFLTNEATMDAVARPAQGHLTQAQLVQRMDTYGIGTDATIADHIDTVQHREYVDSKLHPTTRGLRLLSLYGKVNHHIAATSFRAMMEAGLREVCSGTLSCGKLYNEVIELASTLLGQSRSVLESIKADSAQLDDF